MTDFRALCVELTDCLEKADWPHQYKPVFEQWIYIARKALAEPEPEEQMAEKLTPEHIKSFLAKYENPADARKFLLETGIIDADGELSKRYRSAPMDDLRRASADVSDVELELCWWQKAARAKLEEKAQAIFDAYCTLADLRNRSVSESEMLAAALRETINQCQDGQGMISAPELLRIATQLDVAEDDIDLFQAQ